MPRSDLVSFCDEVQQCFSGIGERGELLLSGTPQDLRLIGRRLPAAVLWRAKSLATKADARPGLRINRIDERTDEEFVLLQHLMGFPFMTLNVRVQRRLMRPCDRGSGRPDGLSVRWNDQLGITEGCHLADL
ncbi:MAG: hypothetical protein M9951_15580 [Burkholderiaceae bacterium]|nr:hypothetical protein [Burkholderiaceae bacterium]